VSRVCVKGWQPLLPTRMDVWSDQPVWPYSIGQYISSGSSSQAICLSCEFPANLRKQSRRLCSMTSAINCFTDLEILSQGNKPPAVPEQRESDLQHPLAHPSEFLQELTGRSIVERRIENSVLSMFQRHRSGERIGEQVRLVRKVFAVLPHHAVQVRRRHHEDCRCLSTQAAGELQGPMCARVNAPLSKHLFRSIADPLSHL